MTSKSQYEKNLDAFAPYYYDDENHIDSLTPLMPLDAADAIKPSVCRYQPRPSASVDNGKLRHIQACRYQTSVDNGKLDNSSYRAQPHSIIVNN
jgi:hypothetical protein